MKTMLTSIMVFASFNAWSQANPYSIGFKAGATCADEHKRLREAGVEVTSIRQSSIPGATSDRIEVKTFDAAYFAGQDFFSTKYECGDDGKIIRQEFETKPPSESKARAEYDKLRDWLQSSLGKQCLDSRSISETTRKQLPYVDRYDESDVDHRYRLRSEWRTSDQSTWIFLDSQGMITVDTREASPSFRKMTKAEKQIRALGTCDPSRAALPLIESANSAVDLFYVWSEHVREDGMVQTDAFLHPDLKKSLRDSALEILNTGKRDENVRLLQGLVGIEMSPAETAQSIRTSSPDSFSKSLVVALFRQADIFGRYTSAKVLGTINEGETVYVVSKMSATGQKTSTTRVMAYGFKKFGNRWYMTSIPELSAVQLMLQRISIELQKGA